MQPTWRKDGLIVLALLLFALLVRCYFLSFPYSPYFDEIYYPPAANQYLQCQIDDNNVHPPGGKLLMAVFMEGWWGVERFVLHNYDPTPGAFSTISWRVGSLVLGLVIIGLTYFLSLSMFKNRLVATLGTFFVCIDMLHIAQCRIAMLDMYEAFWIMLGLYFSWLYIKAQERDTRWAIWAGIAFGCGVATKWSTMFAMLGALVAIFLLKDGPSSDHPLLSRVKSTAKALGIGAVLTVVIYALVFIPLFRAEYWWKGPHPKTDHRDTPPTLSVQFHDTWDRIVYSHELMWSFRHDPKQFHHRYLSLWWQWPTCIRPIWYIYHEETSPAYSVFQKVSSSDWFTRLFGPMQGEHNKWVYGMVALGSVWTWWFFLLFLVVAIIRGTLSLYFVATTGVYTAPLPEDPEDQVAILEWKQSWFDGDEKGLLFCVLTYLPQVLLWSVNTGFMFYMLPCVPLMSIVLGHTIADWREMPLGKVVMTVFIIVAVVWTAMYWPLITGYPVPKPYFERLMLTNKWI